MPSTQQTHTKPQLCASPWGWGLIVSRPRSQQGQVHQLTAPPGRFQQGQGLRLILEESQSQPSSGRQALCLQVLLSGHREMLMAQRGLRRQLCTARAFFCPVLAFLQQLPSSLPNGRHSLRKPTTMEHPGGCSQKVPGHFPEPPHPVGSASLCGLGCSSQRRLWESSLLEESWDSTGVSRGAGLHPRDSGGGLVATLRTHCLAGRGKSSLSPFCSLPSQPTLLQPHWPPW